VWVAALAPFALGCPDRNHPGNRDAAATARPLEIDEGEPNGGVAAARVVRESVRVRASLSGDDADEDYYRLEVDAPDRVAAFAVAGIPGTDLALELLDRDGNHVALVNSDGDGGGEAIAHLRGQKVHIVRVYSAKKGAGGPYVASVAFSDADPAMEVEPNNRAVDAIPLSLGRAVLGRVGDRADEDWFRCEVPLPAVPMPPPEPLPATTAAADASPESAARERSEDSADASADGSAAAVAPLTPGIPAVVRLEVAGIPGVRLQVEVANQAQAVFYTARSREAGEGIKVRYLALRPGETSYFLTVRSAWMGAGKDARRGYNLTDGYTLTLAAEETGSNVELEPNDDAAHATALAGDGVRQGFLAPKGDGDYFTLRYDLPSLVRVELSGVDRLDAVLSLVRPAPPDVNAKEEVLLRANDGGLKEGELLGNLFVGPGELTIKVEVAPRLVDGKWVRDQENAVEPYRLASTSRPDDGSEEREPNNIAALATAVGIGKAIRGWIHPRKDVDLFRLDLSPSPVKVPLKVSVSGTLKVDVALALFRLNDRGEEVLVQKSEKGKGEQSETVRYAADPGVYLVEVRDTRGRESNFLDAYHLLVEQDQ
jgi:hypothetical protein